MSTNVRFQRGSVGPFAYLPDDGGGSGDDGESQRTGRAGSGVSCGRQDDRRGGEHGTDSPAKVIGRRYEELNVDSKGASGSDAHGGAGGSYRDSAVDTYSGPGSEWSSSCRFSS